jgi:hypothetical protein
VILALFSASFAAPVECRSMGSNRKSLMTQLGGKETLVGVKQDIINLVALFANKVLVLRHQRVEVLRAT